MKKVFIWLCVFAGVALILWGLVYLQKRSVGNNTTVNTEVSKIKENDWARGDRASTVVLAEYSDFQCPACGAYEPLLQQLVKDLGSKFVLVYRHFPLPQHKQAPLAAQAAEAAGLQGKFWEMHDVIFEHQKDWTENTDAENIFLGYAKTLGLDEQKFKDDFKSDAIKNRIASDRKEGEGYGINSTPTFYLNGHNIHPTTYDEFKKLVQDASGS